jgi:hypothetical protein
MLRMLVQNFIYRTFIYTLTSGLVWCPGQNKRIAPLSFFHGCRKRRLKDEALTHEVDCDQTAMGLPPVTSAVLLIAK